MHEQRDLLRRKALVAAGSVVLAMGLGGCNGEGGDSGGLALGPPDCTGVDDWAACCEERAGWCESYDPLMGPAFDACYYGPDMDGSTGCIPWGPPAPPHARSARA